MNIIKKYVSEAFYIDLRSLALFRVSLGLICLYDLIMAWTELRTFYTDWGVLPRSLLLQSSGYEYWLWSFYNISGVPAVINLLFIVHLSVILMLIFGFKTRLATVLTWAFTLSLIARNPTVITSAYVILRMALFWGIFLPLGSRWSLDEALDETSSKTNERISSPATFALIFQILSIYFFAGILKSDPIWDRDFQGVYYSLSLDMFATKFGLFVREYPLITTALTYFTVYVQRYGILLLIFPIKSSIFRIIALILFISFHIGLWSTMHIGWFQAIGIVCLTIFIPSIVWKIFFKGLSNKKRENLSIYYDADCGFCKRTVFILKNLFLLPKTKLLPAQSFPKYFGLMDKKNSWVVVDQSGKNHFDFEALLYVFGCSPILYPFKFLSKSKNIVNFGNMLYRITANNRITMSRITGFLKFQPYKTELPFQKIFNVLIIGLCFYVLVWNITSLEDREKKDTKDNTTIPTTIYWVGPAFQIMQHWGLFAPYPMTDDGWFVIPAKTKYGEEFDLLTGTKISWEKPTYVAGTFPNDRWRKYLTNLKNPAYEDYRNYLGRFLCREWNGPDPVETFEIYFMSEQTPPPGQEVPEPTPRNLWKHRCY